MPNQLCECGGTLEMSGPSGRHKRCIDCGAHYIYNSRTGKFEPETNILIPGKRIIERLNLPSVKSYFKSIRIYRQAPRTKEGWNVEVFSDGNFLIHKESFKIIGWCFGGPLDKNMYYDFNPATRDIHDPFGIEISYNGMAMYYTLIKTRVGNILKIHEVQRGF